MNFTVLLSFLVILQAPNQNPGSGAPKESVCPPQLEQTIQNYEKALSQKDPKALSAILGDEFQLITASGKVLNKNDMLANLGKSETQYESFESTNVRFRKLGNTIIETGKVRTKGKRQGKLIDEVTLYTDVWVFSGDRWVLLGEHSSFPGTN